MPDTCLTRPLHPIALSALPDEEQEAAQGRSAHQKVRLYPCERASERASERGAERARGRGPREAGGFRRDGRRDARHSQMREPTERARHQRRGRGVRGAREADAPLEAQPSESREFERRILPGRRPSSDQTGCQVGPGRHGTPSTQPGGKGQGAVLPTHALVCDSVERALGMGMGSGATAPHGRSGALRMKVCLL